MAEIGILAETRYWIEWWQRASDGTFDRDYSHQLDPTRDDLYDYGSKAYMTRPRDTGKPSAMGPYVDYGGVDDYLVTVSVPVASNGVFVGIVAADIRVASLERSVAPWLAQAGARPGAFATSLGGVLLIYGALRKLALAFSALGAAQIS